jgi:hypothetical protein
VVVAVVAVWVMEPAFVEIIDVVAVRHDLMTTVLVAAGAAGWLAVRRVGGADGNHMLVVVIAMQRMQMAVVQVIYVVLVLDAGVAAVLAVNMGVGIMGRMGHFQLLALKTSLSKCSYSSLICCGCQS